MSMNIGTMMRALMGEMQAEGTRALELRVGQIVRGVLLQIMDNQEALMSINGVQVRAKLETGLAMGRGTLLQVMPGSSGSQIALKPLPDTADFPVDEGLQDALKSFGLPDEKWSDELLRGLKHDGYPIGKDTAEYFRSAAVLKPAALDTQSWMGAADVAFRRGLPMSGETLGSLRQALFGPPVHEEIEGFAAAWKEWRQASDAPAAHLQGLAARVQTLLAAGEALLAEGEGQLLSDSPDDPDAADKPAGTTRQQPVAPDHPDAAGKPATAITRQHPVGVPPAAGGLIEAARTAAAPEENAPVSPAQRAVTGSTNYVGVEAAIRQTRGGQAGQDALPAPRPTRIEQAGPDPQPAQRPLEAGKPAVDPNAAHQPADHPTILAGQMEGESPHADIRAESAWIGRFLQWLGAGHEHGLLRMPAESRTTAPSVGLSAEPGIFLPNPPAIDPAETVLPESLRSATAADSLKSALLSLASHEDAPPALREAAQSLVNHITGQQLLLSSERQSNTPFSLMTLFVPMKSESGDTTATVHVQARRSRRGEWDTDNCRLLFDLRMRHLGDTVVDVQVVDRIVSVKLMNDYPGMAEIVDYARDEISAGLRGAGFQLLSMTASALPSYKQNAAAYNSGQADKTDKPNAAAFAAKPYKGVDFRV